MGHIVDQEHRHLGGNNLKSLALNVEERKKLMKKARAHTKLVMMMMMIMMILKLKKT
jgi:hypothetical protein